MKTTIYANYGVLAAEKTIVYTVNAPHEHSITSEKITVEIPESLNPYITTMEEVGIEPENSYTYLLTEAICSKNDAPAIEYADKLGHIHTVILSTIK